MLLTNLLRKVNATHIKQAYCGGTVCPLEKKKKHGVMTRRNNVGQLTVETTDIYYI